MQEFNLIEESWIRVLDKDCRIKEVGIREALLNSHEFVELSGETKTQDFAVLRLLLAMMYTIFYRYDIDGNEIDVRENKDAVENNWKSMWADKRIPSKPVEKYLAKWHDRFWLFDDVQPFYQTKAVEGKTKKTISSAKMIGTLFESENKVRLFADRKEEGRVLSYPEAARWLMHLNCFDDIAAKNPTPKRSWVGQLGLIALKGKNLFETIMLNFCADLDVSNNIFDECPSWEQDNYNIEFNRLINVPRNQAALLSLMSRRVLLCRREDNKIEDYYLAGGDYFEDLEVFQEQMTLWAAYQESKKKDAPYKYRPRRHDPSRKIWQEFSSIVGVNEKNSEKSRRPGVIDRLHQLDEDGIIEGSHIAKIVTAAVIYDYGQLMTLPVIDVISDSLNFHTQILENETWYNKIVSEVEKCDSAAYYVSKLYKEIQNASGRRDKDAKTNLSGEIDAKMRFYDSIDEPFRLWLEDLRADEDLDPDDCMAEIEKTLKNIAFNIGNSIAGQAGIHTIFGSKEGSSVKALNHYFAVISKIFDRAGYTSEEKNQQN
ncbi:MAG: type I-E CRISPR-associated protein Cse1/CasA [Synergistaceae bacterium]|nr:type I-E CRISPR-associated protein Cse1/CasA [Synergistaceae bacterium]